ncbi:MAG: hypothetical protein PHQ23_07280, partial [Candidatus Wallbacteria bacterium]|nr:hypothetical protein [Candidatus Wallbacteria bacterium]
RESEEVKKSVHSRDLADHINKSGGHAIYIPSFAEIEEFILANLRDGDVVISMGAGDIYQISCSLKNKLMVHQKSSGSACFAA